MPVTRSNLNLSGSFDATPRGPAAPLPAPVTPLPGSFHRTAQSPPASASERADNGESLDEKEIVESQLAPEPPVQESPPTLNEAFRLLSQVVLRMQPNATTPSNPPAFQTPEMKKPDSFDGYSHQKLRAYLQQCKLIFLNDPSMFAMDIRKTVYESSYLTGKAFKWIQPYLENMSDDPEFLMNSWSNFKGHLITLFGDPNELRKAEHQLDVLTMRDSDQASTYISFFRALESRLTGWNDHALMFSF